MAEGPKYLRVRPERNYDYKTTLAIDWGSEAVRMKLYYKIGEGETTCIEKLLQHTSDIEGMKLDRQEVKRQFTSHIYPFGHTSPNPPGAVVYPGNNRVPDRRSISSKLGMYAVVGISDEVARQSPELQELRTFVNQNPELKHIIRLGIEQMMFHVLHRLYRFLRYAATFAGRTLDAIALTIPAQWTIEFEEEYGERFLSAWAQVFDYAAPELIFLNEGQTNAHYAFYHDTLSASFDRQHLSEEEFFDIGKIKNAVLLIDAGGHSTNTSLVSICQDNSQLEIRPDRGAIGGTALWAWHILQLAKATWARTSPHRHMPVEMENQIIKMFYGQLPEFRDHTEAQFHIGDCGPNRDSFHRNFTPQELVTAFEDANAHAFALIEQGILELKSLGSACDKIRVVIGGGSAQGPMWIARMTNLCRQHQMEQPIYLWQIDQLYEYARLASGANYALANAKSVSQFVGRAAFGLSVKKRFRGEDGWTVDWHYLADMLWARGNKWVKSIKTDGTEDFKIICQPEYDNPRPRSTIEPNYKAYDLLPIPCRKRGILKFDFDIDTDTDKLKLKINHRELMKSGKTGRSTELGNVEFDLWVPPGSRCLQIWDCVEDIERKVNTAFSGHEQPADNDGSDGDGAEEMDIDAGAAQRPAQQPRSLRRSLRGRPSQAPQAAADVDMDAIKPKEEDHDGDLYSAALPLRGPAGAPGAAAEDVAMGGMEDEDGVADSISVAPLAEQPSDHPRGGGQVASRSSRRGSRVPTGMFAL